MGANRRSLEGSRVGDRTTSVRDGRKFTSRVDVWSWRSGVHVISSLYTGCSSWWDLRSLLAIGVVVDGVGVLAFNCSS